MGNRTERDTGFGPIEMRRGTAGFPGWRGLQRIGDAVLDPGRFYRNWNAQITDGQIECRGGQLPFSDMGSDDTRKQCITSIFCTNNDWPDIGERAEIWASDVEPAGTAIDSNSYRSWRGDLGTFDSVAQGSITRRQRWLRDGVGNTSSGAELPDEANSSVRIRNRIFRADLDGAIRYLLPGETTWQELAAAGIEFGAVKPLAMLHRAKLIVIGIDTMKSYDLDTGLWTVIAMPGGTTGFIPAGWTVFESDDCLYIFGTITLGATPVLIKFDGTTATLSYSVAPAGAYAALGIASNNGRIAIAWATTNGIQASIVAEYSDNGSTFSTSILPADQGPSAMCVADGMIFSVGGWSEEATGLDLLYSWDGSEWLEVLGMGSTGITTDAYASQDIVQIAPVDNTVQDTTVEP